MVEQDDVFLWVGDYRTQLKVDLREGVLLWEKLPEKYMECRHRTGDNSTNFSEFNK